MGSQRWANSIGPWYGLGLGVWVGVCSPFLCSWWWLWWGSSHRCPGQPEFWPAKKEGSTLVLILVAKLTQGGLLISGCDLRPLLGDLPGLHS